MKQRLQGLITGVLIGATLTSGVAFAENLTKAIDAVYMNVKLVVDGVQIEPKDSDGNYVEPFIYNGTTYLPVRAIGQAFKKEISWDGNTATIFIGGKVDKPAKEVYLWNKPYLEVGEKNTYTAYEKDKNNYLDFQYHEEKEENYVVFPLNGKSKSAKGTLKLYDRYKARGHQVVYEFFNESGKSLYKSPIITESTMPIDFEFNTGNALQLKVKVTQGTSESYNPKSSMIENFRIVTTDY